jgi:hypothetical protein
MITRHPTTFLVHGGRPNVSSWDLDKRSQSQLNNEGGGSGPLPGGGSTPYSYEYREEEALR